MTAPVFLEAHIMIQDIGPHQFHIEFVSAEPADDDIILSYDGDNVLFYDDGEFFRYSRIPHDRELHYLFRIDDTQFWLCDLKDLAKHSLSKFTLRSFEPRYLAFAAITGWQIAKWMEDNVYCGRCGKRMEKDRMERAMRCPECGNIVYPRISPAVIVGILNDKGQILVTQYSHGSYRKYALVAGYCEAGESVEQTVIREVREETNLDVTDLQYYKSQPWGFSSSLLYGFYCRAHGDQEIILKDGELRYAGWADPEEEIDPGDTAALTSEMIRRFRKGQI